MLVPSKRWKHFAAMALIGDGVMAVVHPQRDAEAWKAGPQVWKDLMQKLHECPALTRAIGAAQIVGGVWWALSQEKAGYPEKEG
jgi:hypothetical protein